ncbi:MAG: GFA family protein [Rhodobacteraceae bacterium]|nr:GFA family protein [Paracoccaceae bacterium]
MRVDGACHCGAIRYEAEVDPARVAICHCTDCQTLSGSAFRTAVLTEPGSFRLLSGTPRLYVKTAQSGQPRGQTFCETCGTPIHSCPPDGDTTSVALRVGTIRQRDQLAPRVQIWGRSAQGWLGTIPTISCFAEQGIPVVLRRDADEEETHGKQGSI